jgi:hypothetical protein
MTRDEEIEDIRANLDAMGQNGLTAAAFSLSINQLVTRLKELEIEQVAAGLDPEEIAAHVVSNFTGDHYWIDKKAAALDVATALRAYSDARAAEERDKIIQHIKAEATKPEHGDGHEHWHVYALLDELADSLRANADQPGA